MRVSEEVLRRHQQRARWSSYRFDKHLSTMRRRRGEEEERGVGVGVVIAKGGGDMLGLGGHREEPSVQAGDYNMEVTDERLVCL